MTNPSSLIILPLVTRATELTQRLYTTDDSSGNSGSPLANEDRRNEWRRLGKKVWRFALALKQLDKKLETNDFSVEARERLEKVLQAAGNAFTGIERALKDSNSIGAQDNSSSGLQQQWVQYWQSLVTVLELTASCIRCNEDTRCLDTLGDGQTRNSETTSTSLQQKNDIKSLLGEQQEAISKTRILQNTLAISKDQEIHLDEFRLDGGASNHLTTSLQSCTITVQDSLQQPTTRSPAPTTKPEPIPIMPSRTRWQPPTVESDDESVDVRPWASTPRHGVISPATSRCTSPRSNLNASWSSTSPLSSPTTSFSSISPRSSTSGPAPHDQRKPSSPPAPALSPAPAPIAALQRPHESDALEIPWRVSHAMNYWDFIDERLLRSNAASAPPAPTNAGARLARTEILATWLCDEALSEAGLRFTRVKRERGGGRMTQFEDCYLITGALTFAQVERLVERTAELYRIKQRQVQSRPASTPRRPSAGTDREMQRPQYSASRRASSRSYRADESDSGHTSDERPSSTRSRRPSSARRKSSSTMSTIGKIAGVAAIVNGLL